MIFAFFFHLLILVAIFAILSLSLNLAMGYTGLLNVGHAAFYGIGAYTSALLAVNLGVPFWIGLLAGAMLAAVFGWLLSFPTLKLRGDYLALATLGFGVIVENVFRNWTGLTRGPLGIPGIPRPSFFGFEFSSITRYLILTFIIAGICVWILNRIINSPFGRVLQAIREDEIAAKTLGKDTFRFKMLALTISAFFAGVAGSLYAHYITFIDPSSFTMLESMLIASMVIIGGSASIRGSIVGAAGLVLLPEPLRFIPLPSYAIGGLRRMTYAALLILIILKRPQGILGKKPI